jgi:hypothetical protein
VVIQQTMSNRVDDMERGPSPRGIRFEVILGSILLAFGLFALPALIYLAGITLLGPYLENGRGDSIALFYKNFFADLAAPSVRAWLIAVGPLLVIALFRLAFIAHRGAAEADPPPRERDPPRRPQPVSRPTPARSAKAPASGRGGRRVEPRIGGD